MFRIMTLLCLWWSNVSGNILIALLTGSSLFTDNVVDVPCNESVCGTGQEGIPSSLT